MSRSEVETAPSVLSQPGGTLVGTLLCLASIVCVQFGSALSAPVMHELGPVATTWLRLAFAALVLMLAIRPRMSGYSRRQWLSALQLGLAISAMTLAFYAAIGRIPLGLTVAIEFLGPLSVAAFGLRRGFALVWPLLAVAGVFLLSRIGEGHFDEPLGLGFAAFAGIGWGAYIILTKRIGAAFPGLEGLAMSMLAAALITTPFGLATLDALPSPHTLLAVAGVAVLTPLLPYALELIALRRLPMSVFGILMSLEPAAGALAGYLILDQVMTAPQLVGTALVVLASVGVTRAAT